MDEQINKVWYIHIMEYCTTNKEENSDTCGEDIRLTDVSGHKKASSV